MNGTTDTAAQLLEKWLANGGLASRCNKYIDSRIRTGVSFYTKTLAAKGQEAAEAALAEWSRRYRMSDYAAGIEPVARGMLALAQVPTKEELVQVIEVKEGMPYPTGYPINNPSQMVVFFNRPAPGCGCQQPKDADLFSTHGRLGLKAVTLQVGSSNEDSQQTARLGLVLPYRAAKLEHPVDDSIVVAVITPTGFTTGHQLTPNLNQDGMLLYSLGLLRLDQVVGLMSRSGGHFDEAIGFPGATDFLADCLPKLGTYFTALAEKLS